VQILQRKTGLSERTICTSLNQLEEYGIIKRKKDGSGNRHIKVLINLLEEQSWEAEAIKVYKQARKNKLLALMEEDPTIANSSADDDEDYFDF